MHCWRVVTHHQFRRVVHDGLGNDFQVCHRWIRRDHGGVDGTLLFNSELGVGGDSESLSKNIFIPPNLRSHAIGIRRGRDAVLLDFAYYQALMNEDDPLLNQLGYGEIIVN